MDIGRMGKVQFLLEPELPGRGGEQIPPPHHLVYTHQGIVHHHRQLIGVYPVGAAEDRVSAVPGKLQGIRALKSVNKMHLPVRHPGPEGRRPVFRPLPLLPGAESAAGPGIDGRAVGGMGRRGGVQIRPGAEAGIDQALLPQDFQILLIKRPSIALIIALPAFAAALVPVQTQPAQVILYSVGVLPASAGRVQILMAQDDPASGGTGREPGQQTGKGVAQVHPAAGAGSKSAC